VRLEPIEHLDDVREEWAALAAASGHPFATWEWNALWWKRFRAGRELHSFVCRDGDGKAVAILPLYLAVRRPVGIARFLGYGDLQSPVCAPEHRPLAAAALKQVTRSGGVRLVLAERLPCDGAWGSLVGGPRVGRGHDRVVCFEGATWDEFLASRSRNFRRQIRNRERRIVRETGIVFRLADDPGRLDADMDALYRLHAVRWGEESTGVFAGDRGAFHRDFAAAALKRGWLRLWFAEIDGEAVAADYGWRVEGAACSYNSGRVRDYDHLSLGFVLFVHSIRAACEDGVSSFHLLAGNDEYKARFAEEDRGVETRLIGPPLLSGPAALGYYAAAAVPESLRRRLTGAVGRSRAGTAGLGVLPSELANSASALPVA
jgi:CelD/BcsL family acetyltransferase involved in cellulose biosynthesis